MDMLIKSKVTNLVLFILNYTKNNDGNWKHPIYGVSNFHRYLLTFLKKLFRDNIYGFETVYYRLALFSFL